MNGYAFLPFCAFLTNTFLLFFGIARGVRTKLQRNYIIFMMTLSLWSFFDFINWNWSQLDRDWVMFIYHIQAPTYLLIGVCFLRFTYSLIKKEEDFIYRHCIWIPVILSALSLFTGVMTKGYAPTWWGIKHLPGPLFIPSVFICALVPSQYGLILIHRSLKKTDITAEKKQRIMILIGSYFVLYISIMTDVIVPHFLGYADAMQLAGASVTFLAVFMHRAITKYDLLPISVQDTVDELFEHSKQGILIIDNEKKIVELNPSAEVMLEMSEYELLKRPIGFLVEKNIFDSDHNECEIIRYSRNGDRFLQVSANRHIRKNQLIGWVLIFRDVTSERQAHKKIKNLNLNLEERVKQRTLELEESQRKLIQQTEDLERISKYKSEFMANMSHEIRTPMNGIIGFTEIMLLEGKLTETQLDALTNIKNCSGSLLDLVNDILDFSKIEADCIALEKINLDISRLIQDSADICKVKLEDSTRDVEVLLDATNIKNLVLGDPTRLKQVFINLINNSIKFTKKGYVLIKADAVSENEENIKIRFSVKDTGIGISEEQQKRIFNAFEQADGSTTRKYGGTGLGLSISKRLVELMGGKLEVSSTVGEGTEFFFTLDLPKCEPIEDIEALPDNERLIYFESCSVSRDIMRKTLNPVNGNYVEAACDLESINKIEDDFSTVLINLNDFDSEKIKALKRKLDEVKPSPRIIAFTSTKSTSMVNKAKDIGAVKHIVKPLCHQDLKITISGSKRPARPPKTNLDFSVKLEVLMVEDNPVNQKLQKKILEKMGHTVEIAEDGKLAVEMGVNPKYDVIFMDMQLPEMSGVEATVSLRKMGIKIPIIALTANAFESDKAKCIEAGMDDFLSKPVNLKAFQKTLKKFSSQLTAGSA
ncbi:MAG: ATP-binding protein [Lentisphaeraceae bacterium]|nr:ATP-binding protein [Lentisphaeraceae bacterium]